MLQVLPTAVEVQATPETAASLKKSLPWVRSPPHAELYAEMNHQLDPSVLLLRLLVVSVMLA